MPAIDGQVLARSKRRPPSTPDPRDIKDGPRLASEARILTTPRPKQGDTVILSLLSKAVVGACCAGDPSTVSDLLLRAAADARVAALAYTAQSFVTVALVRMP